MVVYSLAIPLTNLQPMIIMHWQPLHHNALSYVNRSSALSNQETAASGRFPACRPSDDSPTTLNRLVMACSSLGYAGSPISRGRAQNSILRGGLILSEIGIPPTRNGPLCLTHRRAGLEGLHMGPQALRRCTVPLPSTDWSSRSIFAVKTPMAHTGDAVVTNRNSDKPQPKANRHETPLMASRKAFDNPWGTSAVPNPTLATSQNSPFTRVPGRRVFLRGMYSLSQPKVRSPLRSCPFFPSPGPARIHESTPGR